MSNGFPDLPPTIYQGRKWDAPMTDDAIKGEVTGDCDMCREPILPEDDALQLPLMRAHLECHVRSGLGDVAHLEGRCFCYTGVPDTDEYDSYRDSSRAAIAWLVEHRRGRFHPEDTEEVTND